MSADRPAPSPGPILVVNPNSSQSVTDGLSRALERFRVPGGPAIECLTIAEGPPGIITQRHVEEAGLRLADLAERRPDASAFVIACYSDPGIDLVRSVTAAPVYGIQEAGVLSALARADRIGVIAVAATSIPRHLRYLRRMGVESRLAGELALDGLSVAESGHGEAAFAQLADRGERLKALGAGAVVLGCAGMAAQRARLEKRLGLPVVDPTQAAVAMALGGILAAAA
ncbi:Asp/Glu/hydantoin racemase [Tistlia consotensis]|uniref:Asp/Glu/hydantoin racemase n=1 Tax=Tistlia consotensis USBA 355 TaxID=560819 RepID=A0A1Y6B535_9PROT|nr:aspartate/glutamate racemase family protein [Tistlia consotensis]SME92599.1 Asp/Glu/hydantoin racemase [Tistlia consotensis USBA 355]SNR28114.1 Asp/Glu/hydantoin racemase [Tistlia consotensis]